MEDPQAQSSLDNRTPLTPWTEIPFVPLPTRDSTQGGQFLSDAREVNIGDGGANVFRVDRQGMWLGAATYTDAPFKVSMLGAVIASALTILGGTITGATIQTDSGTTTGLKMDTSSFRGYNSTGDQTLLISATTGYITIFGYSSGSLIRTISLSGATADAGFRVEDANTTEYGFQWRGPTSGGNTASRQNVGAFYHLNQNCAHGDGFVSTNTYAGWDGKHFVCIPDNSKNVPAFYLEHTTWSGVPYKSSITTEGYLDFYQYHHHSEFDENPAVLASTLIAQAYWEGGGTNGTQEIRSAGADGYDEDVAYMRLSTTTTAGSDSTLTFFRSVDLPNQSRWEAFLRNSTTITTTEQRWGWYYDATHYAFFYFDTDVHATKLYFRYNNGGTATTVDLGVSMPTNGFFYKYTIQCYSGYMFVYFEDVLKATITTSPTNFGKSYFYVDNKSSAVERTIDVCYVKHWSGRKQNA